MIRSNTFQIYRLIFILFILGFGIFTYRSQVLNVPLTDRATVNSWVVEANLRFVARQSTPIKASMVIPSTPPNFYRLDEYFVSDNYGVSTSMVASNRVSVWSLRRGNGNQSLYYRATFQEIDDAHIPLAIPPTKSIKVSDILKPAVDSIVNEVRQTSADIQTFAQATIKLLNKKNDNVRILVNGEFSEENIVKAATLVLSQAHITAVPVKGILLNKQITNPEFTTWLLVHDSRQWLMMNPQTGNIELPKNLLIWQYGDEPIFTLSGGDRPVFSTSVIYAPANALAQAKQQGLQTDSQLIRFSLLQLPINTQEMYKILLTIPIGAFVILLLRNFIGLSTFGTFMPVLIALAFRETSLAWGVALFSMIVSFGLLLRFYLNQLHLLVVPRLAVILCFVILLAMFISIFGQNLAITTSLSIALFPMVILTMTIERMCILWDERGAKIATSTGINTLIAAIIAFYVMNIKSLQYLLFAFPELLFVVMAVIILFGQYRGYRLTELFRFSALAKNQL